MLRCHGTRRLLRRHLSCAMRLGNLAKSSRGPRWQDKELSSRRCESGEGKRVPHGRRGLGMERAAGQGIVKSACSGRPLCTEWHDFKIRGLPQVSENCIARTPTASRQ